MKKETTVRRYAGWIPRVAAIAVALGLFAATPVTALADGGGDSSGSSASGYSTGNDGTNSGNRDGEGNGGIDNGTGNGGSNSGNHGSSSGSGTSDGNVPEVPYAIILPIAIIGMTIFVYRRRTKSA